MTTPAASVAILLFTRSAGQEAVHKQFVSRGGRAANAAVAAQLTRHAATTARQAGVDVLLVDSAAQTGATFGQRLSGAMRAAFAQGYEQLLVIGNDCPQLDAQLLRRALALLATSGAVLGPATDGGVYLLGVARPHFDYQTWAALPWQTATLGQALARQLRTSAAALPLLPALADVDNARDLARALRQPLPRRLARTLRRLGGEVRPLLRAAVLAARSAFVAARPHRGPPAR